MILASIAVANVGKLSLLYKELTPAPLCWRCAKRRHHPAAKPPNIDWWLRHRDPSVFLLSDQFEPKFAADRERRLAQRVQCHRVVVRIKQAVQRRSAGVHPPRHLCLGKVFFLKR